MSMHGGGWGAMRSLTRDSAVAQRKLAPGTARRVISYAGPYKRHIAVFLALVTLDSALVVATPLLLGAIVDRGVLKNDSGVVVRLSLIIAALAILDGALTLVQRWYSSRIGEGLIFDLRTQVFTHVLRQPIAFFTRAQTGALVSRLNNDVIGAQQAFTSTLSGVVSNVISVVFIVAAMASKSWTLTLGALALLPFFLIPARVMGQRLAGLSHEAMGLNAELGTRMTERFNVAGALLVKLFGQPRIEDEQYSERAGRVRDIGVKIALSRTVFFVSLTLVASLATALIYGAGGLMVINASLQLGELVALAALLGRLYGPLTALSNVRVDVMTALVSFERVFEVLDLEPLVKEVERPVALPQHPLSVEFEGVGFRYPSADEVSLASLETVASGDRRAGESVLHDVTFTIQPGELVALVGPSGAGKTTITSLVARLYDPTIGQVRLGGIDLREATLASVHDVVGVVTQDAHLFHDTIRSNLAYAKEGATEEEMVSVLKSAQVWDLVSSLPEGLDTVVGDRGHRLSGGEKQRLAIARLLLKGPGLVVLDEATAHLDSESELAVQRALDTALAGRTALVIAHRLSTVRGADQILVVADGRIVERGKHHELLAQGGLYADLYNTQFSTQANQEPDAVSLSPL
ncbi:MAG: ABC transporter ATP-binding protein [Dermatophilaceae bacterium]